MGSADLVVVGLDGSVLGRPEHGEDIWDNRTAIELFLARLRDSALTVRHLL
jgi:hypothetical protein